MGTLAELKTEAEQVGVAMNRVLHRLNPEGFIEFQLRQSVSDAIKELGKERVLQIIQEAAE